MLWADLQVVLSEASTPMDLKKYALTNVIN
jgi:hypothetical protein